MTKALSVLRWMIAFMAVSACVEPIAFDVPPPADIVVVDGMINDGPGPYYVRISSGRAVDADSSIRHPIVGASVTLHDDSGVAEQMTETKRGVYSTMGVIRGQVGRAYHISIKMPDGSTFESNQEVIPPTGKVDTIRYQYEARVLVKPFGLVPADVFNVYIDAHASTEHAPTSYVRWRLTGTYKIVTVPQFHATFLQTSAYLTPWPCSGFVVEPALGGGKLVQREPCTCCTCWVKLYETKPQLSDTELVEDGEFRNIKVGEVPITTETFSDKFLVEVEQMPLSKAAYDFFKLIRTQKDAAHDLFQPPSARLAGNVRPTGSTNAAYPVVGLFWATSLTQKTLYLTRNDLPYGLSPPSQKTDPCTDVFANSTTIKPANWND